ncbi:MAG: hypothetical protein Q9214_006638, partial [Letrouitia sp. 1 TL-2023]
FSPAGKTLASASEDGTVRLWDTGSGAALAALFEGHSDSVSAVAFSPDGKTLASASEDGTVRLWDTGSGAVLAALEGHSDSVSAVAFSPDGKTLASASEDGTVRLWDAEPVAASAPLAQAIAFSPDYKRAWGDTESRVWDDIINKFSDAREGRSAEPPLMPKNDQRTERPPLPPSYQLGLNLGDAPQIDEQLFIGREDELACLHKWLSPSSEQQNVVTISGLGGIGKTQLGLHFARQYHHRYSAIVWLNTSSEVTLKAAYVSLAQRIRRHNKQSEIRQGEVTEQLKEEQAIQLVRQWLSQAENKTWLLMFDNYDDPRLPGIGSSTGYDIRSFFPYSTQGSILITTRSSRITFAKVVRLSKFDHLNQSLAVLTRRSGRQAQEDVDAKKLAKRFDGLPLALATAGDYISQTADSFGDYLHMYEQSWDELAENSDGLMEYDDRTLYSTWNLSLKQVAAQDAQAAELFRLMGYLGNADLWYELFRKGAGSAPDWFWDITKSKARFNKAMATLHSYSLIEAMPGHYSLHTCVHDWILGYLISKFDMALFGLATHCVARSVVWDSTAEYWVVNSRLNHHALRIEHCQEREVIDWNVIDIEDMHRIGFLDSMMGRLKEAEEMLLRALKGYEKAWGAEHTSTLNTVNNLGNLYSNQGKMAEAEEMYLRALKGYEKVWGTEHTSTLNTVNNLGNLYSNQGKMAEAEE